MEDKGGLDMSSYDDLPTPAAAAADCNGVKDANENVKGNGEDHPDASCVFVAGNDSVPDEAADSADLNGKSELVYNIGSRDNDVEDEVTESDVDHATGDAKGSAIEADAGSIINNEVTSNDGKGEDGAVEVPKGTTRIVGPEALVDQREFEEEHLRLDSPGGVKGTQDISEAVEFEPELLQFKVGDARAGEENSTESIVAQESQVTSSTDVAELKPNYSVNVDVTIGADTAESEPNQSGVLELTSSAELELNHSGNIEVTRNVDVTELEPNQSSNDEVTSSADVAESEPNQSSIDEVTSSADVAESEPNQSSNDEVVESVRDLNLVTVIKENQDSSIAITEGFQNDGDLDMDQGKEPIGFSNNLPVEVPQKASEVESEQNMETSPCRQNRSEQNSSSKEVETLIPSNAEIGRNETPTSLDAETGKSYPATSNNEIIGYPANNFTEPVVHLESEAVNGHITYDKGESLPADHAEESVSHTIAKDFAYASQTTPEENKPSEVVKTVVHDNVAVESYESIPLAPASETVWEPVVKIVDYCPVAVDDTEVNDDMRTETLVEKMDVNSIESVGSHSIGDRGIVIEPDSSPLATCAKPSCLVNDEEPEIETGSTAIESGEKASVFSSNELDKEPEVSEGASQCVGSYSVSDDYPDREASIHDSVENSVGVKAGSKVENTPTGSREFATNNDGRVSECEGLNGSVITSERTINCIQDAEKSGDQLVTIDGDEKTSQEMEVTGGFNREEASTSSPESSSVDASKGQNAAVEVGKKPFYYMIRIPRYDDYENLKEQIKHAQFQVDEKTKSRDVIRAEMRRKRANCNEYGARVDAAISEEVPARDLLKAKRKEIDAVLSLINRVKSAFSVEDIDGKIRNMERMIQHETLPLKEEKNYIREIKQLKQIREQLSSSLGNQEDVLEAIDQKDQVEERLKLLRKEADQLRENVLKAEAATRNAKKTCQEENAALNELTTRFRAADDTRQEAYAHLQSLRKRLYDKNKYFWKYRDDSKVAYDLASKGDKEELQNHCVNQVEMVMDLWNNIDEFRREYTRCNMKSTLKRLQTLDGRSLGPDEEPPVIPNAASERIAKDNIVPSISTLEGEKTIVPVVTEKTDDKSTAKVGDQNNPTAKSRKATKHVPSGNGLATVSGRNEIDETEQKEDKQTKEEEELARKAEELRKEEEAAMLKEQRRLEEKAKAKEAMERKKRNADKAQARAALRALKEAEQKEKEREKRAIKKEKRKALAEEVNAVNEGDFSQGFEPPIETKESETSEKPKTVTKRSQKPLPFTKQTKSKSMPPPLRNRGKRRMETWMWVLLTALLVLGIFLPGNGNFLLERLGF
ncbi:uncharacterized protein LOC110639671 isoform X2 [Hevea brasiliensis]|nr:uncharacterized protein LOC110639671 isoform X2 [Hevea brasiliensis]